MKSINNHFGEKLSRVLVKQATDFISLDNYVLADEIIFLLEKGFIQILPIIDTDELVVEFFDLNETINFNEFETFSTHFTGRGLSAIWNCVNTNGYSDLFIISFNNLHPSLLVLSEGSSLKLFDANQLSY